MSLHRKTWNFSRYIRIEIHFTFQYHVRYHWRVISILATFLRQWVMQEKRGKKLDFNLSKRQITNLSGMAVKPACYPWWVLVFFQTIQKHFKNISCSLEFFTRSQCLKSLFPRVSYWLPWPHIITEELKLHAHANTWLFVLVFQSPAVVPCSRTLTTLALRQILSGRKATASELTHNLHVKLKLKT